MQLSAKDKPALIITFVVYLIVFLLLAAKTETDLFLVFIGTLPIVLHWAAFFALSFREVRPWMFWGLPVVFPLAWYVLWASQTFPVLSQMQGTTLAVLNLLIIYGINIPVLFLFVQKRHEREAKAAQHEQPQQSHEEHYRRLAEQYAHQSEHYQQQAAHLQHQVQTLQQQQTVTQENFNITLRSIEDKCKAINFVIGRVYADKKGGSANIREKLRIPSEWYNAFSELTESMQGESLIQLLDILEKMQEKLVQMEEREDTVLLPEDASLPVEREEGDRIIDVLAKNDKDPVSDYYQEAREISEKLIRYLRT
jgi:hypothetical protein